MPTPHPARPKRPSRPARSARPVRLAAVLGASAALLTAPQAVAHAETAPATVAPLDVLTYNTFLMSTSLYPNWGQAYRAQAIAGADFFPGHDVVVLEEAFDNSASDALVAKAATAYPYHTPVVGRSTSGWDATSGSYSSTTPEDGGVVLLSRWPILRKEQYVFKDACGSDWWSNKGFVYAQINVNGQRTHVVGTHLQSTDSGCASGQAADIRGRQLRAMKGFLDAKQIPADEPIVLAGDLNVDSHGGEYPALLSNGDLAPASTRNGWADSFDTVDNSIAAYRYPGEPKEDLDYVLYRADHARPQQYTNTVHRFHSAPWTVSSWGTSYTYSDLSDHYPLLAG